MSLFIKNETYTLDDEIKRYIKDVSKLTKKELQHLSEHFGIDLKCLMQKINSTLMIEKPPKKMFERCEKIVVPLPTDTDGGDTDDDNNTEEEVKPRPRPHKKVNYRTVQRIVSKKTINDNELQKLLRFYQLPSTNKPSINDVWFAAIKKGHLFVLKQLHRHHVINVHTIVDKRNQTSEQVASRNEKIAKWLSDISTKKVNVIKKHNFHIKQKYSSTTTESSD